MASWIFSLFVNLTVWIMRSWLGLLGGVILLGSSFLLLLFLIIYLVSPGSVNPYFGAIGFLVIPLFFLLGLAIIMFSNYRYKKYVALYGDVDVISEDLFEKDRPKRVLTLLAFAIVFVMIATIGAIEAMNFSNSPRFCAESCHSVMEPQGIAHQRSAHSKVACVDCHVGEGLSGLLEAKTRGAIQVAMLIFGNINKPIVTHGKDLPSAEDTCLDCHDLDTSYKSRIKIYKQVDKDENNSVKVSAVLFNTGKVRSEADKIYNPHFHQELDLRYYSDKNDASSIKWVKMMNKNGTSKRWVLDGNVFSESDLDDKKNLRSFDCIDCHNRTGHSFEEEEHLADRILIDGIVRSKPFARKKVGKIIHDAAMISDKYERDNYITASLERDGLEYDDPDLAFKAISSGLDDNLFARLNIGWNQYKDNIGHPSSMAGCFRCHNKQMKDTEGKSLNNDCDSCHKMIADKASLSDWENLIDSIQAKNLGNIEYKDK